MPHFSVSLCVYHKDNPVFFEKAVESVTVNQTLKPDEVVIVVDGPVGGRLKEVVKRYESDTSLFKVIWLPENVGHAGARRAGFEAASHEIIAIMDADDIAHPRRFEKQIAFMTANPDIAVSGGQITEFVDEENNIVGKREVPLSHDDILTWLKGRCPFNQMSVAMLRSPGAAAGGYLDWFCNEDYYLWIRMAEAGCRFANLPDTLVNVRVGKDMYARRGGWKYFRSEAGLQRYMLQHKIISLPRYLFNVAVRFAVQVAMPNRVRGFVFQKLFRK